MDKESWRHCFGRLRVSQAEIEQIIAEHLGARFGVDPLAIKVEIWPKKDQYGNEPFANVDGLGKPKT